MTNSLELEFNTEEVGRTDYRAMCNGSELGSVTYLEHNHHCTILYWGFPGVGSTIREEINKGIPTEDCREFVKANWTDVDTSAFDDQEFEMSYGPGTECGVISYVTAGFYNEAV